MSEELTPILIPESTIELLLELARTTDQSVQAALRSAIQAYRTELFMVQANKEFAALRADSQAWAEELEERAAWDVTAMNGFSSE